MASHRYHPTPDDPAKAILYDFCPGCEEHAGRAGLTLDRQKFARAWNRMVAVKRDDGAYVTENEARLCRSLYHTALLIDRHPEITNPWLFIDGEDHE